MHWHTMGTFWALFHFSAKSPKNRVQKFLILRENFGAGDRDRTGDVQLGNWKHADDIKL